MSTTPPAVLISDSNMEVMSKSWCHTTKKQSQHRFEWTIREFSTYHFSGDTKLESSIFSAGVTDKVKLRVQLSSETSRKRTTTFLTVGCKLVSGNIDNNSQCKISLLDYRREDGEVIVKSLSTSPSLSRLVDFDTLHEDYLPDDCLTLRCELTLVSSPRNSFMRVHVPESSLVQDLGDLLDNPEFSDFEVCVGDKVFPVHKNILATRSSVFRAMFEHDMKEKHENRVHITDMDSEVVHQMLRFIYTGKVDTDKLAEFGVELLGAADKYDLQRLKALCEECLCDNLTVQNCVQVLDLANMYRAEQLKSYAMDYINWNADRVEDTSGWKLMLVPKARVQDKQFETSSAQPKSRDTQEQE